MRHFSRNFVVLTLLFTFAAIAHAARHHAPNDLNANPNTNSDLDVDLGPEETLAAHNKARAEVGVVPMTWDPTLEKYAQDYANQRSKDCAMRHSMGPYGENLAMAWVKMNGKEATLFWLTEKKYYNPATKKCIGDDQCGHYAQIIAPNSLRLGCGSTRCDVGEDGHIYYVICNYAGNPE